MRMALSSASVSQRRVVRFTSTPRGLAIFDRQRSHLSSLGYTHKHTALMVVVSTDWLVLHVSVVISFLGCYICQRRKCCAIYTAASLLLFRTDFVFRIGAAGRWPLQLPLLLIISCRSPDCRHVRGSLHRKEKILPLLMTQP